ncbi:helix-turn-helix domain-containing protein [Ureibacillus manganicus]|uniref:helix-turn-helix domain-containing protein n=1 Tax=Ureibacillus manganicus TaxID=1266064 RepID=UPI00069014F0|nr:helix-turn-helix transcriptional regulator [Ureibacillus manganicus]
MTKGKRELGNDFGKLLKHLRQSKGYSLQKMARLCNVTPSYLNRLESGHRKNPSINILEDIAVALGTGVDTFLGTKFDSTGREASLEELFFNNEIEWEGINLSANTKDSLLKICTTVLAIEWVADTMLEDLKRVGELIIELKEEM